VQNIISGSSGQPGKSSLTKPLKRVELFTDGACTGNPGPGGWCAILRFNRTEREMAGYQKLTTNNQMEMTAVIEGLRALKEPCHVTVYTDSQYVHKGFTQWISQWKRNGWRTSGKEPVKNRELWQALDELAGKHHLEWVWVRGHAGHPENERCDELARNQIIRNTGF